MEPGKDNFLPAGLIFSRGSRYFRPFRFLSLVILSSVLLLFFLRGIYAHDPAPRKADLELPFEEPAAFSLAQTIRVRGDWDYPPFEYLNPEGEPEGFIVDIVREVAQVMQMDVTIELGPWEEVRSELEQGKIDAVGGMFRTKERDRVADFSIPHLIVSYAVFVPLSSEIETLADVRDKTILVSSGDLAHDYLREQNIGEKVIDYPSAKEALLALSEGKADAAVLSRIQGMRILSTLEIENIVPVGPPIIQTKYCIAVPEGRAELLYAFNEGLSIIKASGAYDRIYDKWFNVYERGELSYVAVLEYFALAIIPGVIIVGIIICWTWSLKRQVRLKTIDLQTQLREKRELELQLHRAEKMETVGMLAGGVAHDLNNVLGAIVGYPDILLDGLPEESPMRKGLQAIKSSGEKAALIVEDLLTLARRAVKSSEIVDVNEVISSFIHSRVYKRLLENHPSLTLQLELNSELRPIDGSAIHISKVVMNLLQNAAEAMPEGGLIKVSTDNICLTDPVAGYEEVVPGDYVVIRISDSGIGIQEKDLRCIFEPFYTRKKMGRSGSGLGMAVVWSSVKDHHGYIDIKTKLGEGTEISVYIPASFREREVNESRNQGLQGLEGRGESVLVIDDVSDQRDVTTSMLERLNYRVSSVSNGEEAILLLRDTKFDLLILDMIMGAGIDGLETYHRVLEIHPEQRVIIVSGYSETQRVAEVLSLGRASFLKKPYSLEVLAKEVKQALRV